MIYYKWISNDKPILRSIPGFVWASLDDAIEMKEEVSGWISGDLNLYSMTGPEPTTINTLFRSSLSSKHKSKPFNSKQAKQAKEYIESKPEDFFGLAISTEDDEELFRRLAATHGALLSTVSAWDKNIKEVYVGIVLDMKLENGDIMKKFTVSEDTEVVLDGKRMLLEAGDELGIDMSGRPGTRLDYDQEESSRDLSSMIIKAELYETDMPPEGDDNDYGSDRFIKTGYFKSVEELKYVNDIFESLGWGHKAGDYRWKPVLEMPFDNDIVLEDPKEYESLKTQ